MRKCAVLPAGMLALGITLAAVVGVSRAGIIYSGEQAPVLPSRPGRPAASPGRGSSYL